jgi:hypothetical protein
VEVRPPFEVAADPSAPARERVAALTALAVEAARARAADPRAADLLDDAPLVDAAFRLGASGAVTGLALALGDALSLAQRRYLARVAAGAGATGLHVAALALAAGEPAIAARAAAVELSATPADAPVHARILAAWLGAGDAFWAGLAAAAPACAEQIAPHAPEVAEILVRFRGRAEPPGA